MSAILKPITDPIQTATRRVSRPVRNKRWQPRLAHILNPDESHWDAGANVSIIANQVGGVTTNTGSIALTSDVVWPGRTRSFQIDQSDLSGTSNFRINMTLSRTIDVSDYNIWHMAIYWPGANEQTAETLSATQLTMFANANGSYSSYRSENVGVSANTPTGTLLYGWNLWSFPWSGWNDVNSFDGSTFNFLRIDPQTTVNTTEATLYLGGIWASRKPKKTIFCMWADDGITSQYTETSGKDGLVPVANSYGIPVTVATPLSDVGNSGKMTWAQLRDLRNDGNQICFHDEANAESGGSEVDYRDLDDAGLTDLFIHQRDQAFAEGIYDSGLNYLAYPTGRWDSQNEETCRNYGIKIARSLDSNYVPQQTSYYESYSIGDINLLRCMATQASVAATSTFTDKLDAALEIGGIVHGILHGVRTVGEGGYSGYWMEITEFDAMCSAIKTNYLDQGTVEALTAKEMFQRVFL